MEAMEETMEGSGSNAEASNASSAGMNFMSDWGTTHKLIPFVIAGIFILFRIGLGILHLIALLYG